MQRIAFKMHLRKGGEEEYKRRHREIWPELLELLKSAGVYDYSIFIDSENSLLFGTFKSKDQDALDRMSESPVMQRWWKYMSDLNPGDETGKPYLTALEEVFYLE